MPPGLPPADGRPPHLRPSSPSRTAPAAPGRRAALLALLALAGCGFRPLHETAGAGLRGQVAVEGAEGRIGLHFRESLRRRIGPPVAAPRYRLDVALDLQQTGLAITPQDDVTRYDVIGRARFTLLRIEDRFEAARGEVRSISAYSTTSSPYATRVAERDAERRVAADLAERVYARIAAQRLDAAG